MSISVDTVNLRFNVKPDYDQQQLQQLQEDLKNGQKELEKTRRAMDKLAKNGLNAMTKDERQEFDRLSKTLTKTAREVHENEQKMKQFTRSADINKMSIQQLGQRAKDLTAVLNNLNPKTDSFKEYKQELDTVKERMKELKGQAKETEFSLIKFSKGFNHIGFAITNVLAIKDRIVQWADQYVQSFAKMDEAMTDVMKYTGQTKAEVEHMNEAFQKMTTRTPREELNALAGAAGRLGITAERDIIGFVDAADKINVALGDDLGEGAIDQIGKLTMVFGEDKTKGLNGAMLATGSAINVLGANSSANTGFITEFTSDMAGMAVNARISQTDIMGYASALSQAGVEGKVASGVFAQLITKMFTDPARFAKAAGLDVKAFTDLLKSDANAAILQFLEGLKQNGGFDALAPAMKSLKLQGTQAVPVISSLINKMDELRKAQTDARQAYDEGTSIIDEFNNANSSAAAKLDMAKKAMNDQAAALGQKLMPIIEGSIKSTTTFLKVISSVISELSHNRVTILTLVATIAAYQLALNALIMKKKAMLLLSKTEAAFTTGWNALLRIHNAIVLTTSRVYNTLRGNTVKAEAAQRLLNRTMVENPAGAVAAAIASLVAITITLVNWLNKASEAEKALSEVRRESQSQIIEEQTKQQQLIGIIKSSTTTERQRKEALDELNQLMQNQHLPNLTEEAIRTGKARHQIDLYNQSLQTRIERDIILGKLSEARKKQMNAEDGEFDLSWWERTKAFLTGLGTLRLGAGFSAGYDAVLQDVKNNIISTTQNTIEALEQRLNQVQEQLDFSAVMSEHLEKQRQILEGQSGSGSLDSTNTSGDSSSNSTTSTTKRHLDRLRKQRQEKEAELKASYEREKLLLRQQYEGKKEKQDEWHEREFQAEQQYLARLAEIRRDFGASESERVEVANMSLDSIIKEGNRQREVEQRKHQENLADIDRQQSAEEIRLAQQWLGGEITTQQQYDDLKLQLEIEYQRKRLDAMKEGSAEYQQAQKRLLQLEIQQADQLKQQKDSIYNDSNKWLREVEMAGESFNRMRELNEEYYKNGRITYQQYQDNLTQIAQEQENQRTAIQQAAIDSVSNLLSSTSSLFSAMQQRETAQVDAKYKRMTAAARKKGRDTTALEEQQEAEKQAIAKKYADRNFKIQILQIVGNTAQGISKTIAELGMPWAVPFVAMAAAAGAMQLASAKAAADQAAGLYSGGYSDDYQQGYTAKGNPREQAGVIPVHKNEFVANHRAVANPSVRPVLDVIDRHQRLGDIQILNATRLLEEAYGRGHYRGGFSAGAGSAGTPLSAPTPDKSSSGIATSADILPVLERIEKNTAQSLTVRDLRREIRHEEQLERNAHR